jgi:hypothetical protein
MKQINTLPIENYLEKARIASKSGQKQVVLDIKEAVSLSDSLAVVMTRLVGKLEENVKQPTTREDIITINMDGGGLK